MLPTCGKCLDAACAGFPGYTDPACAVHGKEPKICACPGEPIAKLISGILVCTTCEGRISPTDS